MTVQEMTTFKGDAGRPFLCSDVNSDHLIHVAQRCGGLRCGRALDFATTSSRWST